MATVKGCAITLLVVSAVLCAAPSAYGGLDVNRLSKQDIKKTETLLARLSPLIQQRREKANLATLTFDELYAPLSKSNKAFLNSFQTLDAKTLNIKLPYRRLKNAANDRMI